MLSDGKWWEQLGIDFSRRPEELAEGRGLPVKREEDTVRALLRESLDLSADESRWLTEYVCAVRELRQLAHRLMVAAASDRRQRKKRS